MVFLYAIIAFIGVISVINLLLILGVVRRLREQNEPASVAHSSDDPALLSPGSMVGDFAAVDLDRRHVSREQLADRTLVGFFAVGCASCQESLPHFVAAARAHDDDRDQVLAVIVGGSDGAGAQPFVQPLSPVARVVYQEVDGPLPEAFSVRAFPSFFVLDSSGRVRASTSNVETLPATAPA